MSRNNKGKESPNKAVNKQLASRTAGKILARLRHFRANPLHVTLALKVRSLSVADH